MTTVPNDQGGVILAVDDVARNLQLLGSILTSQRYEVLFATSGEAALERVAARKPDLILLDLMMPGMDGMEVCRRLKADPKSLDVPVIFLTAAAESSIATEALGTGAVDYICKPFNAAELLARVRTHVALKRTRDELHRIIGQKNELLSVVAHDLKNPISSIRFSALILREQGITADDPRTELVDSIVDSCEQTLEFIQQHLARNARSMHYEQLMIGEVDLIDVINHVVEQNLPAASIKSIVLDLDMADPIRPLKADRNALCRALNNLVSNAIKFSPAGRTVKLQTGPAAVAGTTRLAVVDNGPGLTPDDHEHLFEPYCRLSAQPTGGETSTGLGLSITRELVKRMGGTIGCDSEAGRGACFWILLPSA